MPPLPHRPTGIRAGYHLHIGVPSDHAFIYHITSGDGTTRIALSRQAEQLIEAKMVQLRYIHDGWGADGDLAREQWEWLESTDVRKPKDPREVRRAVEQRVQEIVESRSERWARYGWWTNVKHEQGEYVFCGRCHRERPIKDDWVAEVCFLEGMERQAEEIVENPGLEERVGEMGTLLYERHQRDIAVDLTEVDPYFREALDEAVREYLDAQAESEEGMEVTEEREVEENEQEPVESGQVEHAW